MISDPLQAAGATAIFVCLWLFFAREAWPYLPLGRPTAALLASSLVVATRVLSPADAYCAVSENLPTLLTLIAIMFIAEHMRKIGAMGHLGDLLVWRLQGEFGER